MADRLRHVFERHAFLGDRVILGARLPPLDRQPVEAGHVQDMRRRPAVLSVPDVGGDPLLAGACDDIADKALLARCA